MMNTRRASVFGDVMETLLSDTIEAQRHVRCGPRRFARRLELCWDACPFREGPALLYESLFQTEIIQDCRMEPL